MEKNDGKMVDVVYLKNDTNHKYRLEKILQDALREYLVAFKTSSPDPHQGFFAKRPKPSICPCGRESRWANCLRCSHRPNTAVVKRRLRKRLKKLLIKNSPA
ncbi:MAG: hypothetical protein ABSH25_15520 [Syntrophorhabdales bacterium]